MLEFKVYERAEMTTLGTVAGLVGKDGKIKLIPRNFADTSKRVVVVLEKKNGTSATVICSERVSKGLRSKEITLAHLLGFNINEVEIEGEVVNMITIPATASALPEFAVKGIAVEEYEAESSEVNFEDLIALGV